MAAIAFIGYGELGSVLGGALASVHDVRAWSRSRPGSLDEAVDGAALVVSAVPGSAAEDGGQCSASHDQPGGRHRCRGSQPAARVIRVWKSHRSTHKM